MKSLARTVFTFMPLLPAISWACPDGYYSSLGMCLPNSGTVTNTVTRPLTEAGAAAGGEALQQWIQQSRNSAIGQSMQIPPDVRAQLGDIYDQDVFNRARFKVDDNGFFNAANNVMLIANDVTAVTLIDVIVFRSPNGINDISLWAHELKHVQQYRDWGVHSFAVQYVRNAQGVEGPAYDIQHQVQNRVAPINVGGAPTFVPTGAQPGTMMTPCGCYASPINVVMPEGRCASGAVQATACPGACPPVGNAPFTWACQ